MNKNFVLLLLFAIILTSPVLAQKNSIKLLAVTDNNKQGIVVDLDLEIVDGTGRVFVETQPLSNIDTQISLRIAKTIACKTSEVYCLNKDFIYSIKSSSPVIAGPSAGAAIALVTLASLENQNLDKNTVITGTINSGGVIGAVGGVKEKIKAAANSGLKTILIPKGEANASTLLELGDELNVTVIEVDDIETAYEIFTHKAHSYIPVTVNPTYEAIMQKLNTNICERGVELNNQLEKYTLTEDQKILHKRAINLTEQSQELAADKKYYSSASRCFGANVYFREILIQVQNLTAVERNALIAETEDKINQIEQLSNGTEINTLGDLEATMIVSERLDDAQKNIEDTKEKNTTRDLAYGIERTYSAEAWRTFLGFPSKPIDAAKLEESCMLKLAEVQEVYNYVAIYLPGVLEDSKEGIALAKEYLSKKDYVSCIFRAAKAQAEIDTAFGALYVEDSNIESLLGSKIAAAERAIAKQISQNTFPILGYSYYEYANTLKDTEKYNALLYAEYGIELSNLNVYFPQKKPLDVQINKRALVTLIFGLIIGACVVLIRLQYKRNKITLKRRK